MASTPEILDPTNPKFGIDPQINTNTEVSTPEATSNPRLVITTLQYYHKYISKKDHK